MAFSRSSYSDRPRGFRLKSESLIAVLFLVFAVSRLLILLTSIEAVSWPEDLSMGTLAREWIRGSAIPLRRFQLDLYSGESFVMAGLIVPFFKTLGQNLFALKMPTYLFSLATLGLSISFLWRHFGRKAAVWGLFFLTFSPPIFISHFLMVQSGHSEALLFCVGMIFAVFNYLFATRKSVYSLLFFGALGGFSAWFYYGNVLVFASCLLIWMAASPRTFFSKRLLLTAAAFITGLMPWIAGYCVHGLRGLTDLSDFVPESGHLSLLKLFKRAAGILCTAAPRAFSFLPRENPLRIPAAYFYYFLFSAAFSWGMIRKAVRFSPKRARDLKLLFFAVYPLVFLGVYAALRIQIPRRYDYLISFRYFTPVYFFGFMFVGIAVSKKIVPKMIVVPLLAVSCVSPAILFFHEPWGEGLKYRGYSYARLAIDWTQKLNPSRELFSQMAVFSNDFEPNDRRSFLFQILRQASHNYDEPIVLFSAPLKTAPLEYRFLFAQELPAYLYSFYKGTSVPAMLEIADRLPVPDRFYFYKGIFAHQGMYRGNEIRELVRHPEWVRRIPPGHERWVLWSLGRFYSPDGDEEFCESGKRFILNISPDKKWYYRGAGSNILRDVWPTLYVYSDVLKKILDTAASVPRKYEKDFYWGVGWQLARRFKLDKQRIRNWIRRLPPGGHESARRGMTAFYQWYGFEKCSETYSEPCADWVPSGVGSPFKIHSNPTAMPAPSRGPAI